jgi:hypothetical protein
MVHDLPVCSDMHCLFDCTCIPIILLVYYPCTFPVYIVIVKNSKDLAQKLSEVIIEDDEIFASHDMVSLFMNTPIDKALQIIRDRLNNDKTLKKRTLLNPDDVMDLCEFILTTTYFQFRGKLYQQKNHLRVVMTCICGLLV